MPKKNTDAKIPDDMARLKAVTRGLLEKLEKALEEPVALKSDAFDAQTKVHERLFGAKASLASTLVTLADLFLKLEGVAPGEDVVTAGRALSEADVALVEAFVQRMQHAETA